MFEVMGKIALVAVIAFVWMLILLAVPSHKGRAKIWKTVNVIYLIVTSLGFSLAITILLGVWG